MKAAGGVYSPGSAFERKLPLERYLPPLPPGMIANWLRENVAPGEWLIDPLGSNPSLPLEAAQAGYRVLVASNNPILTFMIETLAQAPAPAAFQAALAELGATRRGTERLEVHLQALYESPCPVCGRAIQPVSFLCKKEELRPFARLITCPHCGASGEYSMSEADLERLARLGSDSLHRSRAIERAASEDEGVRATVEEAVRSYLPRPLYVIFTLLNRVEGLPASPARKRLLTALLLSLLDEGSTLWSYPSTRSRPRQLTTSPVFRENNLWLAFEKAIQDWTTQPVSIPVTRWPELPPEQGGICLFPGRLRALLPIFGEAGQQKIRVAASIAVLPRPNQAFWTLSALWAGWLWGRDAVQPLKIGLERKRYDWQWHASALHSVFSALNGALPRGLPLFAVLPELAPGFLTAAICAGQAGGLKLTGMASRSEEEPVQILWETSQPGQPKPAKKLEILLREGIQPHLELRGEPDGYLSLLASALAHTAEEGGIPMGDLSTRTMEAIQPALAKVLTDPVFLTRFGNSQNIESGQWWLANPRKKSLPLAERIEERITRLLKQRQTWAEAELDAELCRAFPGLNGPPPDFVRACLNSYAKPQPNQPETWQACAEESHELLQTGQQTLLSLAPRLGFDPSGSQPISWAYPSGLPKYAFYLTATAMITALLTGKTPLPAAQCILVFPTSRDSLIQARLQRDALLSKAALSGWRFLKIELLVEFARLPAPTLARWEDLLNSEQPRWRKAEQMEMF